MANRTDDLKISLYELQRKTFSSVKYLIKVPNFFTLSEYDDIAVGGRIQLRSPSFKFCSASWQIVFQPEKKYKNDSDEWIKSFWIYLERFNSYERKQDIFCIISLLDGNDKVYDKSIKQFLTESDNKIHISDFDNDDPSYDRRDTLSLIFHLIGEESHEMKIIQEPVPNVTKLGKLPQDIESLLLDGKNHDLTLKVGEKEFPVHCDVLSMLSHDMTEKNKGFIDIVDCDSQAMEQFLIYVYSGILENLNEDNVIGLYYLADRYGIALLKEQCSTFLKQSLSPSIICDAIQLSLNHSDTDLLQCATEYFINNTNDIFPTLEWMSFLKSNVDTANELLIKASQKWNNAKS